MKMPEILLSRPVRAMAALFVIAWLALAAWYGYDAVLSHPVSKVVFAGAIERLPPAELEALSRSVRATPGRPSLENVRQAARHIHWVRDAGVRRISADTLEIRFEAHEPFARWNDDALVSRRGEVFVAEYGGDLPQLRGAEGTAAQVALEYPRLAAALEPLGSPLVELRLTPRGAWQATLASGLALELGRNDMEARIARLASVWPELQAHAAAPSHIDLRYPNGFALRQPPRPPQQQPKKKA
jgi:cell division protein FtsQ